MTGAHKADTTATIIAVMAIVRTLATRQMSYITCTEAQEVIEATGRSISRRTVQRILQHMCAAGVLVQARPHCAGEPIQFSLAQGI